MGADLGAFSRFFFCDTFRPVNLQAYAWLEAFGLIISLVSFPWQDHVMS
jgi:hypothetical protein